MTCVPASARKNPAFAGLLNEAGLEPTTSASGGRRSIQMSYSSGQATLYRPAKILYSSRVKPQRTLADPRLTALLQDLLAEEALPALDRWFSRYARSQGWPVEIQKTEWDELRRALTRAFTLLPEGSPPVDTSWPGFRVKLRGRAGEWALRASHPAPDNPGLTDAGIPAWLSRAWDERLRRSAWSAAEQRQFLAHQERAAPVHVRFRAGDEGEACRRRLLASGSVAPSDVDGLFQLAGGRGLEGGEDWKHGLVEIQDAASQLSLRRLELRPGHRVWDVCAGQGGKTLLAAHELRGKGALTATDVSEGKLKALKDRIKRSGWQNLRVLGWDGNRLPDFGPEMAGRGGFDRVIVDAPCSASGTWRRDPDGRFRLVPLALDQLVKHQERLVRLGWQALKPGGRLAYVTCSWLPAENEAVVEPFVDEVGARVVHQELLGLPAFDANTLFACVMEKSR